MNTLGIHLLLRLGKGLPTPAPARISEALQSLEVTHDDSGSSGFQLTFGIGRGLADLVDYRLVTDPLLQPGGRVHLTVVVEARPYALMDGVITNRQVTPGDDPGAATLVLTGEDVSVLLDRREKMRSFPGQNSYARVMQILLASAAETQLLPDVRPPQVDDTKLPVDGVPTQYGTDLSYIRGLAAQHGYVFYVVPGLVPGKSRAYWGPVERSPVSQKALSVNMGPHANVESISFQYNALAPTEVKASFADSSQVAPPKPPVPPMAVRPAPVWRTELYEDTGRYRDRSLDYAQARADRSLASMVSASGELDALRYGGILEPRRTVDVRGAGHSYDGTYYVQRVSHRIDVRRGEYKQSFNLSREGEGAISPVVRI